jgi:hypothetical protein
LHLQVFPSEHTAENEGKEYEYDCQSLDQGFFAELIVARKAPVAGATGRVL